MAYTVYILKSESSGRFYTGYTENLEQRLIKHRAGSTKTTRNRGPWKVAYTELFETKEEATKRERELKRLKSRGIYEKLKVTCAPFHGARFRNATGDVKPPLA